MNILQDDYSSRQPCPGLTMFKSSAPADRAHHLLQEYLGIAGEPAFAKLSAQLAFGDDSAVLKEGRNATMQCLSGTGSLRVGAEFLKLHYPVHLVYIPNPTWANHLKIFPLAGAWACAA